MEEHVCPLIQWNISSSRCLQPIDIRVDAFVEVDEIGVEEEGILRSIPKVLPLHIPSSLLLIVCVVVELWLEVVDCLLVPMWMTEEARLSHHERCGSFHAKKLRQVHAPSQYHVFARH